MWVSQSCSYCYLLFETGKRAEYCFESAVLEGGFTEFLGKFGELCETLGEFVFAHKQ